MATFYAKQGDKKKKWVALAIDASGNPIPLPSGTQIKFYMQAEGSATAVIDGAQGAIESESGEMSYTTDAAGNDTSEAGRFQADWKVIYQDGTEIRVPTEGHDEVIITRRLGSA